MIGTDDAGFQYKKILKTDLLANLLVESVDDVGVNAEGHTAYLRVANGPVSRSPGSDRWRRSTP